MGQSIKHTQQTRTSNDQTTKQTNNQPIIQTSKMTTTQPYIQPIAHKIKHQTINHPKTNQTSNQYQTNN